MTVIILLGFPLLKRIFCNWKLFTHNCTSFCWWLPVMFSWILCKKYIDWLLSFLGLLFKQTFLWYIVFCSGFVENIFVFDNHALTRITKNKWAACYLSSTQTHPRDIFCFPMLEGTPSCYATRLLEGHTARFPYF